MSTDIMHPSMDVISVSASDSEAEVSSLCGSELELEMAWGEGPIAPLRNAMNAEPDKGAADRSSSNGNGSSRARTPQKRSSESPLAKSKRLINIHPIRSAAYLPKPNELPVGVRKQQRWFNDHHFGNRVASTRLEDLMEHMAINVEWKSNFEKLAQPQNQDLQTAFRKGKVHTVERTNQPKPRRNDEWGACEEMFLRIDRRARTLVLRSFQSFAPFIEAIEYVVLHFVQWFEVPSDIEVASSLHRVLVHPMELYRASEKDIRLVIPLVDSAFHRLIIHSVCQFYGVRSRTEANRRFNTKIMVLKCRKTKLSQEELARNSLCEFIRETRLPKSTCLVEEDHLEQQTKSSECSDGYCMMDYPQI